MSDPLRSAGSIEATRATAQLPGLEIEIVHRVSPNRDAEQISINLQALPRLAFGRWLVAANPFSCWMYAAQLFWTPWLDLMNPDPLQGRTAAAAWRRRAAAACAGGAGVRPKLAASSSWVDAENL